MLDSGERFSPGFLLTFQIVKMAKSSDWSARGLTIPVVIKCRKYSIDRSGGDYSKERQNGFAGGIVRVGVVETDEVNSTALE